MGNQIGFTHYYRRVTSFNASAYEAFIDDVRKMVKALPPRSLSAGGYYKDKPLVIRGAQGTGKPTITKERLAFNGDGEDGADLDHETFYLPREFKPEQYDTAEHGRYFEFCKTARKPYDLLVVACLFAAKHYFGDDILLSSDGNEDDLRTGYDFWRSVCGIEAKSIPDYFRIEQCA